MRSVHMSFNIHQHFSGQFSPEFRTFPTWKIPHKKHRKPCVPCLIRHGINKSIAPVLEHHSNDEYRKITPTNLIHALVLFCWIFLLLLSLWAINAPYTNYMVLIFVTYFFFFYSFQLFQGRRKEKIWSHKVNLISIEARGDEMNAKRTRTRTHFQTPAKYFYWGTKWKCWWINYFVEFGAPTMEKRITFVFLFRFRYKSLFSGL